MPHQYYAGDVVTVFRISPSNELVIEGKATIRKRIAELDEHSRVEFANMSALPPKADIVECDRHVRLVPKQTFRRPLDIIVGAPSGGRTPIPFNPTLNGRGCVPVRFKVAGCDRPEAA
jgi:hypothetical protein